ncbi:MAG: type II toxin-antitoxin system VapC family toxin [Candidatus Binatia bacterium]
MIVDSSAVLAIVFREPGFGDLIEKIARSPSTGIGAPTAAEIGIVLGMRLGGDPRALVARLLQELAIEVVPFGDEHWKAALAAWARFGRKRHRASLNFGDCLTYAVAKLAARPLLFVGDDFARTDLLRA